MLKINNYNTPSYYNSLVKKNNTQNVHQTHNSGSNPSFGASPKNASKVLNWIKDQFNIDSNGSLTRAMFLFVAGVVMVGCRYMESRDKDEKREVLSRDIPAILITVLGAPILTKGLAYHSTKKTGIPVVKMEEPSNEFLKKFKLLHANFSSQKQLTNWYSNLGENAVENFTKTIDENSGNIRKAFEKLGIIQKLEKITTAKDNTEIRKALKEAKENKTAVYQEIETFLKELKTDNPLLSFAKKKQSYIKLTGIGITAAILGYLLPHLNIVVTRNKYKKRLEAGEINKKEYEKKMIKASSVYKVSNSILSFHKTSAQKTFKNMLAMVEHPLEQK